MANDKKIELWDGYEVKVNDQLIDDFDFITDLAKAQKERDIATLMQMYFAVIGGENVYKDVRKHIEKEKGYFSQSELFKIINKVDSTFPKAGDRAPERSWSNSK